MTNLSHSQSDKYILYWMQQAQRVEDNPALQHAISLANRHSLPLVVLFVLTDEYPSANIRHYDFMMQGMLETLNSLHSLQITSLIMQGNMVACVTSATVNAIHLVMDVGYLKVQREWRNKIIRNLSIPVSQIETEPFMPVQSVMQSEAYGALSIRVRIYRLLQEYAFPQAMTKPLEHRFSDEYCEVNLLSKIRNNAAKPVSIKLFHLGHNPFSLDNLHFDSSVQRSNHFTAGNQEAKKRLVSFATTLLSRFHEQRSNPADDVQTGLSPYLHFGQISIRTVIAFLIERQGLTYEEFFRLVKSCKPGTHPNPEINGLLSVFEQGVVRRELSFNFCTFNPVYDSFACLPEWAKATLQAHQQDTRPYVYTTEDFEQAKTHDKYWNAAQMEMVLTGKMHGYMRMYWGKKLLEWCADPIEAYQTALYLNNKYELDGRDANAYAGVAWCFGKHDRPWTEHSVFGNVRSMNESGLNRKFDMLGYINRIKEL